MIGYASHLASDALTKQGIELFHPIRLIRIHGNIQTGSHAETIVMFLVGMLNVIIVLNMLGILNVF